MNQTEQKQGQILKQVKQLDPNNMQYFQLMQIIGTSGKYQNISLILWCIMWTISGQLLLGTTFLLYNPPYINCPSDINITCNQYVCNLPQRERIKYLDLSMQTLANQFGDYHCQNSFRIQLASACVYFGNFIGYLVVSWMNDNLGRRRSILIALIISFLGVILISFSVNLAIAQIGLFLAGFGIDPAINTTFYFITQSVQNKLRQKHSTLIQFFFAFGGITNVIYYAIFKDWRFIYWIFFLIPMAALLFLVYWFVQQTPQFMIMLYSKQQTIQSLKKIAAVNKSQFFKSQQNQKLLSNHIQKLRLQYQDKKNCSQTKFLTPIDMFRYQSIRYKSIYVCILSFSVYLMYYGPLMLLEKYNLNIYISAIVLTSSDLIVYPILYFTIKKMKRKLWGKIFFTTSIICAVILLFIVSSQNSFQKVLQMIIIFCFRFAISFQFALFGIYETQIFPAQIRGIAIGFASALGTVASTTSPILFGQLQKTSFPVMTIFIFFGSLSLLGSFFLPQTINKRPPQQIQEFQQKNEQNNNQNYGIYSQRKKSLQLVQQAFQGGESNKDHHNQKNV